MPGGRRARSGRAVSRCEWVVGCTRTLAGRTGWDAWRWCRCSDLAHSAACDELDCSDGSNALCCSEVWCAKGSATPAARSTARREAPPQMTLAITALPPLDPFSTRGEPEREPVCLLSVPSADTVKVQLSALPELLVVTSSTLAGRGGFMVAVEDELVGRDVGVGELARERLCVERLQMERQSQLLASKEPDRLNSCQKYARWLALHELRGCGVLFEPSGPQRKKVRPSRESPHQSGVKSLADQTHCSLGRKSRVATPAGVSPELSAISQSQHASQPRPACRDQTLQLASFVLAAAPSRHIITPAIYLITSSQSFCAHRQHHNRDHWASTRTDAPADTMAPATASTRPDIIVVGAGIVGSALAYSLGKSGRKVALFERDFDEPDRIVGELLQPGGVRALAKMGIVDTLQDIDAVPRRRLSRLLRSSLRAHPPIPTRSPTRPAEASSAPAAR
ncbi:hypothetical protein L1887_51206 [Cichorium endivia]|nr:hypothetical protein L1887_51206 [Cichorium endivia]